VDLAQHFCGCLCLPRCRGVVVAGFAEAVQRPGDDRDPVVATTVRGCGSRWGVVAEIGGREALDG
jgi:hypothetical protein